MAIYIRCTKCKTDHKLDITECRKCGGNLKRNKKYKVVVKNLDRSRTVRIVETLTLAKRVENSIKGRIAEKKHFGIQKAPLISDIWEKYAAWAIKEKKDWRHDLGRWKWHVAPHIKDKRMDQLMPIDVETIIDSMKKLKTGFKKKGAENAYETVQERHAPATRKHILVLIKRVYNWAINRELYHGPNPANKIEAPKINNQLTECLTRVELDRLLRVLDNWVNIRAALIVRFALHTGFRLDEVIGLEWKDVDTEKRFAKLVDPKGNPVTLPICDEAVQILGDAKKHLPTPKCPYVFPNKKGERRISFGKIWSRIRKKAEIPKGFRFHGLRHTFASYLASSGQVDLYTLQKLLNHQDPKMTQRYAHLLDEALRRGVNVADKVFMKNT
jgi:integrase